MKQGSPNARMTKRNNCFFVKPLASLKFLCYAEFQNEKTDCLSQKGAQLCHSCAFRLFRALDHPLLGDVLQAVKTVISG